MDYRASAQKAIDAAYEDAVGKLFSAWIDHLTEKLPAPHTTQTLHNIIETHKQMTQLIADAEI